MGEQASQIKLQRLFDAKKGEQSPAGAALRERDLTMENTVDVDDLMMLEDLVSREGLLNLDDTARFLGVERSTVYQYFDRGLKYVSTGGHRKVNPLSLAAFLLGRIVDEHLRRQGIIQESTADDV